MIDIEKLAEKIVDRKIKFYKNLKSYIVVNGFLAILNLWFSPDYWWFLFPVFFWGICLVIDFLQAFVLTSKWDIDEYRQHKVDEEIEKLGRKL